MYAHDGCDIIYCAAGQTGDGVFDAAEEQNFHLMGVDLDQSDRAPKNVIASSIKKVGQAMFAATKEIHDQKTGGIQGGNRILGFEEGAVGIAFGKTDLTTNEIKAKTEDVKNRIISGEISVPSTKQELEEQSKQQTDKPA